MAVMLADGFVLKLGCIVYSPSQYHVEEIIGIHMVLL